MKNSQLIGSNCGVYGLCNKISMIKILKKMFEAFYLAIFAIISIPLNLLALLRYRQNFKNGQIVFSINKHDKLKVLKPIRVNAKAYFEALKIVKFTCKLPKNTILIPRYDFVKTQKKIEVRPNNYDEYEDKYIPYNIKNEEETS